MPKRNIFERKLGFKPTFIPGKKYTPRKNILFPEIWNKKSLRLEGDSRSNDNFVAAKYKYWT